MKKKKEKKSHGSARKLYRPTVRPRKNETENYGCFYHNLITIIINK